MFTTQGPNERVKKISQASKRATKEKRTLPLKGDQDEVLSAAFQALDRMTPEQKEALKKGILAKVYGSKNSKTEPPQK